MFDQALEQILVIARSAWGFLAGLLIVTALLGGLFYALQGSAGAAFGGSKMAATAVLGVIGLALLVMFAFLVIPEMGAMLQGLQPAPPF